MKTYLEADVVKKPLKKPCEDCPFARKAIPGWLAGQTPSDYVFAAHRETEIQCHTKKLSNGEHVECAGTAIYRKNVCKSTNSPLKADKKTVFASPKEFIEHHLGRSITNEELCEMSMKSFHKHVKAVQEMAMDDELDYDS